MDEGKFPEPDPELMKASLQAHADGNSRTAQEILTEMRERSKDKPEELSQDACLAILSRLRSAFQLVENTLTGDFVGSIYILYGRTQSDEVPTIRKFEHEEAAAAYVNECRAAQTEDPNHTHYIHIFYGQRWLIQKGDQWKLWTGKKTIPIAGGDILPFVDSSGTLTDESAEAPSTRYADNDVESVPTVRDTPTVGEEPEDD